MSTIPFDEFIKLATEKDYRNNFRNPKFAAHKQIVEDQRPPCGRGSKSGFVLICDRCGRIKFTNKKDQQYCKHCGNSNRFKPSNKNKIKPDGLLTKRCAACFSDFQAYSIHIEEGRKIYCSRHCADNNRGYRSIWYYCEWCGRAFKTTNPYDCSFCSIDCETNQHEFQHDPNNHNKKKITGIAHIVNEDERKHHDLNLALYKHMHMNVPRFNVRLDCGKPTTMKDRRLVYEKIKTRKLKFDEI
jgi:hypothetical protein